MSIENLHNFLAAISENPTLQSQLREILSTARSENGRVVADKVAALSLEAGTPFTAEEFLESHASSNSDELSEEELQSAAGGYQISNITLGGIICNWG